MNRIIILLLIMILVGAPSQGHNKSKNKGSGAKVTVADLRENDYDVLYVKMQLDASDTSTQISGSVLTRARVTVSGMTEYVFELSNQLTIDSAKINGNVLPVNTSAFIRSIPIPVALNQNNLFTTEIFYHGQPAGGTNFFTNGILHQTDAVYSKQVTHTISAAFHARDWWPCKQSLLDKIDSADIWITVPSGLKVAGNGLLKNTTPMPGNRNRFEWHHSYPADYYLLSFAVADYDEYNYYLHFSGSNDSMLIQNFIYDDPLVLQQHQDELDTIGFIVNHFSELFGRYPFYKEKFGICMMPLGGGMENQTMVSLGSLEMTLTAHELSHQWWGNAVTCATWKDVWLHEGMASYCEHLFLEHFRGNTSALQFRNSVFNNVMTGTGGSVYVDDTSSESRIYHSRLTYDKGAAVAHMLRFVIHNDNIYFQILRQYQQQFMNSNASTEDLKNIAEQFFPEDLDTFFKQWVYKEGYPTYAVKWFQSSDNHVFIKLAQTTSKPSSVAVFKTPLEIRLQSALGDTTIRIFNDQAIQYYSFDWMKTMTGLQVDPDNHILNKTGAITNDPSLSTFSYELKAVEIYPNPAIEGWNVQNIAAGTTIQLFDVSGRMINEQKPAGDLIFISSAKLAAGNYVLRLTDKKGKQVNYHLLRL